MLVVTMTSLRAMNADIKQNEFVLPHAGTRAIDHLMHLKIAQQLLASSCRAWQSGSEN